MVKVDDKYTTDFVFYGFEGMDMYVDEEKRRRNDRKK